MREVKMRSGFMCPICRKPLEQKEKSLVCESRHCFDIAKSGYVNLLASQGGIHGDDKTMVRARHEFLKKGYYAPLKAAMADAVRGKSGTLLDAGCGDCYYTQGMRAAAPDMQVLAVDISKDALHVAKEHSQGIERAVASTAKLPLEDGSVDVATVMFAPVFADELARVLRDGGELLIAAPCERHLFELKEILYENPYENDAEEFADDRFVRTDTVYIKSEVTIDSCEDIKALFLMTPYFYRTSPEAAKRLDSLERLKVTTEFKIMKYEKKRL